MSELVVPTGRELEAMDPAERWELEDQLDGVQDTLRAFNDEELRRWVEVEHKTQVEIAKMVGRSQSRVQQRCAALGLVSGSNRGRPRITSTGNSNGEVLDGEVVDDAPRTRRPNAPDVPAHAAQVMGSDLEDPRTQLVEMFSHCWELRQLFDGGAELTPRSDEDRERLLRDAKQVIHTMNGVQRRLE